MWQSLWMKMNGFRIQQPHQKLQETAIMNKIMHHFDIICILNGTFAVSIFFLQKVFCGYISFCLSRLLYSEKCSLIRMDRQRREEELKNRSSKKGQDAEQSILNRVCCTFLSFYARKKCHYGSMDFVQETFLYLIYTSFCHYKRTYIFLSGASYLLSAALN